MRGIAPLTRSGGLVTCKALRQLTFNDRLVDDRPYLADLPLAKLVPSNTVKLVPVSILSYPNVPTTAGNTDSYASPYVIGVPEFRPPWTPRCKATRV